MEKIKANWQKYALGTTVIIVVFVGGILIGKMSNRFERKEAEERHGRFQGQEMEFKGKNWKNGGYQRQSPNLNDNQNIPTNGTTTNQITNPSSTTTPPPIAR